MNVRSLWTCACIILIAGCPRATAGPLLFDMGTPNSAVRAGFTRVTPQSLFSAQTGFGWQDAKGLEARDKAWAEPIENVSRGVMEPPPIYTNELTQDVILGAAPATFTVTVPADEYRVYVLCGASEAYRSQYFDFSVAAGQGEEPVQIEGGYRFEHRVLTVRPDAARRLEIQFRPRNKWLVNAILIWPTSEDERVTAQIVQPLEREIYVLPESEWKKWREEPHVDLAPFPPLSDADRKRGYLVHHRHYLEPVYPNTVPLAHTLNPDLRIFAAPGEYEPLTFTVYPLTDLKNAAVQVSPLRSPDSVIPASQIDVRRVRYMLARPNYRVMYLYRIVPDLLEHFNTLDLPAQQNQRFWLTVHVPEDAKPGDYRSEIVFRAEGHEQTAIPVRLRVLPIRLQEDPQKIYGIYYRHPYDLMASATDEISKEYFRRKAELEHADMLAHGTRNITLSAPSGAADEQGKFSFNFDLLEQKLDLFRRFNFKPPIVMSISTGSIYRKYLKESYGSHLSGVKQPPPEFSAEMTAMVRTLEEERKRRGWPEFLYYPVDEPGRDAESVQFMITVLKAVRAAGVRTYVTADPTADAFQPLKPYVDVWCTQPFAPDRDTVLADSRARGVEYWCYPNHINGENDHTPVAGARMTYGFGFWRSGFRTLIPWIYQSSTGDPFNYLDGAAMDFFNRSEPDGTPIPVTLWEAYREGYDDGRYIATLEQSIERAKRAGGAAAAKAAEVERELRYVWDAIRVQPKYKYDDLWAPEDFDAYRWLIASQIIKMNPG